MLCSLTCQVSQASIGPSAIGVDILDVVSSSCTTILQYTVPILYPYLHEHHEEATMAIPVQYPLISPLPLLLYCIFLVDKPIHVIHTHLLKPLPNAATIPTQLALLSPQFITDVPRTLLPHILPQPLSSVKS